MSKIKTLVEIVPLSDIPEKIGKSVSINTEMIALFRLSNGEIRAIENRCPHKGGVLSEGMVSGDFLFCPMHDWKICMSSGKVQAPDNGCIKTYETEIKNDRVYIYL